MKYHTLGSKHDPVEEMEREHSSEERKEQDFHKIILIDKSQQPGHKELASPSCPCNDEGSIKEPSDEKELYSDAPHNAHSPVSSYFKTISRFPLLNEREERILAQRIKEKVHCCQNQIVNWNNLLKEYVLKYCSPNQLSIISEKLYRVDKAFRLFDKVIMYTQERTKINRSLNQRVLKSHAQEELLEQLHKGEAEISKCIAEIQLSKTTVSRAVRNLKKFARGKVRVRKQETYEKSLVDTLSEISHHAKEVKFFKNQMIQANLRLVISIAKRYVHRGLALPDVIQEGNLGLIRAVDTYDYRKGYRLITYATWWIKQAIIRAHDYQARTVRTPVYINEKLNLIEKASNRLRQKGNRTPTLEEIATEANTPLGIVEKIKQNFKDSVLLDTVTGEGSENIPKTASPHTMLSPSDHVVSRERAHTIDRILSHLTPRERKIVKLRFGIGEKYDHTLEQIGGKFNISRERTRQILEASLDALRKSEHITELKDFIE